MDIGAKKQKLLIEYLISSIDIFAICQSILEPEYFNPEFRNGIHFIQTYHQKYNSLPDPTQIEAESDLELVIKDITPDKIEYFTTEIEAFIKRKAIQKAIVSATKLIETEDYSTIEKNLRDAILISLNRDLGLFYYENPEERLRKMLQNNPVISTGWKTVDDILFGGISRKELLLVSGGSGAGKSLTLTNLGLNISDQGYNVAYVSLELSEDVIAQRIDTMLTGISRRDWKEHIPEIVNKVQQNKPNSGSWNIKQMTSGTRAVEIDSYLQEYYLQHGFYPDFLALDYLDKMHPNEKNIDLGDVWTKDKFCSEQLRDLGVKYNIAIATASQLNREAVKAQKHDHSHIAGGISKINESDIYFSITMNDIMKAAGECNFAFEKTRNSDGVGKVAFMKYDQKFLRILDRVSNTEMKIRKKPEKKARNNLIELMTGIQQ